MKKIYFACSIRGGRDDQPVYEEIVNIIKTQAHVLSELFSDPNLTNAGHTNMADNEIWKRDLAWLKESDGIIAEVSNPSLGVGYEIARAEDLGKPILVLYRQQPGKKLSAMIAGSPTVQGLMYKEPLEASLKISDFINTL
jgi:hypothetical protein